MRKFVSSYAYSIQQALSERRRFVSLVARGQRRPEKLLPLAVLEDVRHHSRQESYAIQHDLLLGRRSAAGVDGFH